jgi:hypothetical protein
VIRVGGAVTAQKTRDDPTGTHTKGSNLSEHMSAPDRQQSSWDADVGDIGLVLEVVPAEGAFSAATGLN